MFGFSNKLQPSTGKDWKSYQRTISSMVRCSAIVFLSFSRLQETSTTSWTWSCLVVKQRWQKVEKSNIFRSSRSLITQQQDLGSLSRYLYCKSPLNTSLVPVKDLCWNNCSYNQRTESHWNLASCRTTEQMQESGRFRPCFAFDK